MKGIVFSMVLLCGLLAGLPGYAADRQYYFPELVQVASEDQLLCTYHLFDITQIPPDRVGAMLDLSTMKATRVDLTERTIAQLDDDLCVAQVEWKNAESYPGDIKEDTQAFMEWFLRMPVIFRSEVVGELDRRYVREGFVLSDTFLLKQNDQFGLYRFVFDNGTAEPELIAALEEQGYMGSRIICDSPDAVYLWLSHIMRNGEIVADNCYAVVDKATGEVRKLSLWTEGFALSIDSGNQVVLASRTKYDQSGINIHWQLYDLQSETELGLAGDIVVDSVYAPITTLCYRDYILLFLDDEVVVLSAADGSELGRIDLEIDVPASA